MATLVNTESNEMWDLVWQTFENASLTYDLVSSQNVTKTTPDDSYLFDNPAKLGILTGFLIACVADFRVATPKFQLDASLEAKLRATATIIINVISFLLMTSLMSPILMILLVYRKVVEFALKYRLGNDFAGLLEGTDSVWALENPTALSVINVLAVLEKADAPPSENFMSDFRKLIEDRLVSSDLAKLNWRREKKYGYFYWRKNAEIRLADHVRWIDDNNDHSQCDGTCDDVNGDYLKTIFANATNKPLPKDHSTSWEILVCRTCAKSSSRRLRDIEEGLADQDDDDTGLKTRIPVMFRVHHCLGDGVALLRLLLESIADSESLKVSRGQQGHEQTTLNSSVEIPEPIETSRPEKTSREFRVPLLRKSSSILGTLREDNEILYYANDLLSASMPFTTRIPPHALVKSIVSCIDDMCKTLNRLTVDDVKKYVIERICSLLTTLRVNYLERLQRRTTEVGKFLDVLISIPSCLVQQALRSMDNSALHGPSLSGEKVLSYWIEGDSRNPQDDKGLMSKIRDIKNATGTRFGDVVLAALSANLHRYFLKINEAAPKTMTVVIPARMIVPSQKLSMQNGFSVGLQSLGVSEVNGESVEMENDFAKDSRLMWQRLSDVSRSSEKLRNDPDYLINFWVMKWLSATLPECLLRPVLESRSTLVFSNLPGPREVAVLGYKLKNVAFWIPHRGTTGLGCSFLTYGEKVHVSLVSDVALVGSPKHLDEIVRGTIDDIASLYDNLALS